MEKEFVPYELAVKLKALGFDEPCLDYFANGNPQNSWTISYNSDDLHRPFESVARPTFSQAFRFFREKYGLDHETPYAGKPGEYHAFVNGYVYGNNGNNPSVFTYEGAEEICLEKLIEIVEQK